ncbi:hypothetical protein IT570_09500 [Candidatus Sumerlaeota bacterium]|nr:hypothetical protein [Candidatus Sumerlaeota bacterium]
MGRQARKSSILMFGSAVLAAMLLVLGGRAMAQSEAQTPWKAGATLAAPGASGRAGTLAFETKSEERAYAIQNTNMTLKLKLLRLSGERELPLRATRLNAGENAFDGTMGSLKFTAVDEKNAVVTYTTAEKVQGLALAELQSSSAETSPTIHQKMGVRVIDSKQAVDLTFEGAPRAFREPMADGYRVVVPIEAGRTVTMKISISPYDGPLTKPVVERTPAPTPSAAATATSEGEAAAPASAPTAAAPAETATPPTPAATPPAETAPATVAPKGQVGTDILATPVPADPAPAADSRRGAPPAVR